MLTREQLKGRIEEYGVGNLHRETGISRSNLYGIKEGNIDPRFSTIEKILKCMNLNLTIQEKSNDPKENLKNENYFYWSFAYYGAPCISNEAFQAPANIEKLLLHALSKGRTQADINTLLPTFIYKNLARIDWEYIITHTKEKAYLGYVLNLVDYFDNIPYIASLYSKIFKEVQPLRSQALIKGSKTSKYKQKKMKSIENKIAKTWKFKTLDDLKSIEQRYLKWR